MVVFLGAEKEDILEGEIAAIVHRITTLSAASVEVGVQFVHLQRDPKDETYILRLLVLIAGGEKKHVNHVRTSIELARFNLILILFIHARVSMLLSTLPRRRTKKSLKG